MQEQKKIQYTVCMDETGKFEEKEDKARFIGGCIYIGDDFEEENKRLGFVYKGIADSVTKHFKAKAEKARTVWNYTVVFPESFHMSNIKVKNKDGNLVLASSIGKFAESDIKTEILKRISAFLSGTYDKRYATELTVIEHMKKRKGKYEIFMMIDPSGAKESFEAKPEWNRFNMTNLKTPGNLYVRLATLTVSKLVYYLLQSDMKSIRFMIASRTTFLENSQKAKEIEGLFQQQENYRKSGKNKDRIYYSQTHESTFISNLQSKIYDNQAVLETTPKKVAFQVCELDYEGKAESEPFMYLSDLICLYIQRKLYGNGSYEEYKVDFELLDKVYQSFRNEKLPIRIWIYEKEDGLWNKALDSLAEGDFVKTHEYFYDIKECKDTVAGQYYEKYWISKAEEWMTHKYVTERPEKGVFSKQNFQNSLSGYIDRIEICLSVKNHNKAKYLADKVSKMMKQLDIQDGKSWYRLYDILLRHYNHCGNLKNTQVCLRQLNRYCSYVTGEEFIETISRALQWYFNQFCFEDVIRIGEKAVWFSEKRREISVAQNKEFKTMMAQWGEQDDDAMPAVKSRALGKAYSSMGQAYAFMGNYAESEVCFKNALQEFETECDKHQTTSYRLHNAISMKNENLYKELSISYFNGSNATTELKHMIPTDSWDALNSSRYDLFVWMKAINAFGWDTKQYKQAVKQLLNMVYEHIEKISTDKESLHPWTLILKQIYIFGKRTGCFDSKEYAVKQEIIWKKLCGVHQHVKKAINKTCWDTLTVVNGYALLNLLEKGTEYYEEVYDDIYKLMLYRSEMVFPDMPEVKEEMDAYLNEHFKYMYT